MNGKPVLSQRSPLFHNRLFSSNPAKLRLAPQRLGVFLPASQPLRPAVSAFFTRCASTIKSWVRAPRPQAQHPLVGAAHHARGLGHQRLHHRADAPALGLVAHGRPAHAAFAWPSAVLLHPRCAQQMEAKRLISKRNVTILSGWITDSGQCHENLTPISANFSLRHQAICRKILHFYLRHQKICRKFLQ